ncbi:CBS domain-containing protein [Actinomadura meyerae]|nr:CBS domain-containing protein [Actinomadura meyerae]
MTSPVITVERDAAVPDVAALLRARRISAVPVVDGHGAVVGLVSEYDLLAREGRTAADVMTTGVISVTEDTDVEEARHLLLERRIRRVPVLSGRELVGIVARSDVMALLTTEWACEVCGEVVRGEYAPPRCPKCHATADRFELQEPLPGA